MVAEPPKQHSTVRTVLYNDKNSNSNDHDNDNNYQLQTWDPKAEPTYRRCPWEAYHRKASADRSLRLFESIFCQFGQIDSNPSSLAP
jgi:hypothetical protein